MSRLFRRPHVSAEMLLRSTDKSAGKRTQVLLAHSRDKESDMIRRTTRRTIVKLMTMIIGTTLKIAVPIMQGAALNDLNPHIACGKRDFCGPRDHLHEYGRRTRSRPISEAKSLYQRFKDSEKQSLERVSIPDPLLLLCNTITSIAAVVDQFEGSIQASRDCLARPRCAAVLIGTIVDKCTTTRAKGYRCGRAWLAGTGKKVYRKIHLDPG